MKRKVPKSIDERASRVVSDNDEYKACMTVVRARMFTIQKILNNEILIPYLMLKVETIYLQFRLMLELLYLSNIVTRKKKFAAIWPRTEKEYQPSEIRKYLGKELDEHFPYPFKPLTETDGSKRLHFFDRPISEEETYRFFNKCHQYLHEPNPYKKKWKQRESECESLLRDAETKLSQFWRLLENHYRVTELNDGEKVGMICSMEGGEKSEVFVANLISESPTEQ